MKTITLTVCFNDILVFDIGGIQAYNQHREKMTFNLEEQDQNYIITPGDDYHYYEWPDQMQIQEMSLYGQGTFHIKMNLDTYCTIKQHDCKCHLYYLKPHYVLKVNIINGILIADQTIQALNLNASSSIVKDFKVASELHINCKGNSFLSLYTMLFTTRKINLDTTSTVIINKEQVYPNNGNFFSNL
jgi:hypothetical protein